VVYNVEMLKETLNSSIDILHFDEAWLPHAAFHEYYRNMHAIGPRPAAAEERDDLRHAFHPQAARRPLAGLADPGAGQRDLQLDRDVFTKPT